MCLGNVYFSDHGNHRIRKVTISTGIISLIAGTGATSYSGDNGPATSAALYYPSGVAVDASGNPHSYCNHNILTYLCIKGNVYIADYYNHRIRKVTVSTGIITNYAGIGTSSYSGDNGQATSAALYAPQGVALDASGKCLPCYT